MKNKLKWHPCTILGIVGVLTLSLVSAAQEGPGQGRGMGMRPRLTPEQSEAAWKLEASYIAQNLGLSAENTTKLIDSYIKVRKDALKAWEERRASLQSAPDAREEMRKAMAELSATAKENLKHALAEFLNEEQTTTAVNALACFDARGDLMVHTIAELNLGEKEKEALGLVTKFVAESRALMSARTESGAGSDFREKAMALRMRLEEDLSKILSEEQQAKWRAATLPGQGGREGQRPERPEAPSAPSTPPVPPEPKENE